uniref:Photosystem II protein J n=1 Tax=Diabelia spathulata var. spathulata TaxID=2589407 RepID=A0A5Q0MWG0_9DIPS|nr:photosystem II protein J [Diabelia spathulata var. spathulata]
MWDFPVLSVRDTPGTITGILVIGLIGIFFYGSYSGLGSSL